ncbi:hypothetical protein KSC_019090 [Ktedonobacter sp. SOSP1-52]|uniref:SMI1/KNR4 family protein n=1 Tax=Ktedonobacter sp. SOSP1-52 TaxID=2778366 RepID=UPI0019155C08|nr:SMI1/KNR4 family protein [Ktedonobacter sp. SOSP1-52]GHO63017.1 hypothetical protein KSC_019090 [Ktedonobacter sp. SOSP1-52]
MDSVTTLWQRIDTWFQTFAPRRAIDLNPGVSPAELNEAETALGFPLPDDFKASYAIHNGASGNGLLMGYLDFSPLSGVVASPQKYQELLLNTAWASRPPEWVKQKKHLPVQPVWRHPRWLDFAGIGDGDQWCLDLAPPPDGNPGQILFWSHEVGVADVLFANFEALLSAFATQLEAGLLLGCGPVFNPEKLTHLSERRAAFQQATPAKLLLHQAMSRAWDEAEDIERSLSTFRWVLQMEAATPDDRFFAYYGLITWCATEDGYWDEIPSLFAKYESEALNMPTTHWVHEEVAVLEPLSR